MPVEPSEADITTVVEVTQASRDIARRYLKAKDNELEKAINALFEGEDISAQERSQDWDDTAFSADRYGVAEIGPQLPAHNEGALHPLGSSAAPTRGSSPVPSLRQPHTKAQEDEEMERALANSRQDLRYAGQESGTIGAAGRLPKAFGPATKSHYDPSQWAMTIAGPSDAHEAREIVPDVDPAERRAVTDEPRFLKHVPSGDYLPSFLTIAHAIPLAKEVLLCRSHVQQSYGQDQDWWRGHAIRLPKIVNITDGEPAENAMDGCDEVLAEMQRLMAFLDRSERAYASTEPLTAFATELVNKADAALESVFDQTLYGWEAAARYADAPHAELFHSVIGTTGSQGVTPNVWSLPLNIAKENRPTTGNMTLADLMDTALWDTDSDENDACDTYMEHCADVLPIRITCDDFVERKLGLEVPPQFHIDKYLKENIAATRVVRKEMSKVRKRMAMMETLKTELSLVDHPSKGEKVEAAPIIQSTKQYFSGEARNAVLAEYEGRGIDLPAEAVSQAGVEQTATSRMAMALDQLLESVSAKQRQLEIERLKAKEMLSKLSQTTPPGLDESGLRYRYTLRGVATKPNVTYVLRPKHDTSIESEGQSYGNLAPAQPRYELEDEDAPEGWSWWRIEFDPTLKSQISRSQAYADDVIRAVELEHTSALLVYASDAAINHPSSTPDLPPPLEDFVRRDNKLFEHELKTVSSARQGYVASSQDWNDSYAIEDVREHEHGRRGSVSSTTAVFDPHAMRDDFEDIPVDADPPAYSSTAFGGDVPHYGWAEDEDERAGLLGKGGMSGYESPEAHEIHLGSEDEGVEMVERTASGKGLLSGIGGERGRVPSVHMMDADEPPPQQQGG